MVWNPQKNIIDTRFIGRNILSFVSANQTDALFWANDSAAGLKDFKQFSESVANRNLPIFPSLAIAKDDNGTRFDSDLLTGIYSIVLEVMTQSESAANLPLIARRYKHALESLLLNMPTASLLADLDDLDYQIVSIETQMDEIKANATQNSFMQKFQTKVIYKIFQTIS